MFEGIENKPYYNDWTNPQLDPKSEQFRNAYNSVVNDYGKENADLQLKDWGITLEDAVENGNITPEQLPENSPIQKEAEQLTDSNPHNDEVKNDAVEDFFKQMESEASQKKVDDGGTDFDYGRAYEGRVELNDAAKKAAEDLGLGNLDPEVKHGYYGDYGDTMKFANKLEKYKKEGIKDKFKSSIDGLSYEQLKLAARNRKNAANLKTTLKEARAEKAYLDGKGSVLNTKPSVYWPKERFDEYKAELAKEINRYENYDNVADKTFALSRLAQKAKFVNQVEEALKYSNAANGVDVNTYNEKPVEKHNEEAPKEKTPSAGINWDKVHMYEPNEDPYLKVSDEYDWKNNPDYEPEPIEVEEPQKDEDFLGPDEYIDENGNIQVDPNWKPENADEDFVGPDEQLAVINDGLPAEIPYEPVYDTSDYNFDWEAVVETLPPDVQQELNELPEEDKEEISELLHLNLKRKLGTSSSGGNVGGSEVTMPVDKGASPSSTRNPVGNSMLGMSLRATNANVGQGMRMNSKMDSNASIASKAPIPPTVNETTGAKVSGSNNNTPRSNGSIGSGSGLLFNKVGMLKSEKSSPEIPMLGHTSNVDELNAPTVEDTIDDMKEGLIDALEAKLNANPEVAESLGFDHKYKHWTFNGISLDEMPVAQLNELTNKLENVE